MNPADVVRKQLEEVFNDKNFRVRLVPDENCYVFQIKHPRHQFYRSLSVPKQWTRQSAIEAAAGFFASEFETLSQGKRNETYRSSSR